MSENDPIGVADFDSLGDVVMPCEPTCAVIAPPWSEVDDADKIVIRIEPNMAFGTGTHETTQLCLRAIEKYYELLKHCEDNVALEELAREMIRKETEHIEEVEKMLIVNA